MAFPDLPAGSIQRISVSFAFSASHRLEGLPDTHKCSRLHGHSYAVDITIEGNVDSVGFVIDFAELNWLGELITDRLDHRHLNEVLPFNPTSELLAVWLLGFVHDSFRRRADKERFSGCGVTVAESLRTKASVWAPL
jgi:6-pyruvoyltetrahydropterin/6-carboxytetrahydropterin synthase